jgi:hypothetical protein
MVASLLPPVPRSIHRCAVSSQLGSSQPQQEREMQQTIMQFKGKKQLQRKNTVEMTQPRRKLVSGSSCGYERGVPLNHANSAQI